MALKIQKVIRNGKKVTRVEIIVGDIESHWVFEGGRLVEIYRKKFGSRTRPFIPPGDFKHLKKTLWAIVNNNYEEKPNEEAMLPGF